jgi:hypothetical protein
LETRLDVAVDASTKVSKHAVVINELAAGLPIATAVPAGSSSVSSWDIVGHELGATGSVH